MCFAAILVHGIGRIVFGASDQHGGGDLRVCYPPQIVIGKVVSIDQQRSHGMKFAAWYGILIGIGMIAQWAVSILSGGVPEFQTEPWRIAFHLAAEFSTALMLIISGAAVLRSTAWGKYLLLVALGMVIYSEIVSPGYFAQLGQWPMVAMFAVILIGGVWSVVLIFKSEMRF